MSAGGCTRSTPRFIDNFTDIYEVTTDAEQRVHRERVTDTDREQQNVKPFVQSDIHHPRVVIWNVQ